MCKTKHVYVKPEKNISITSPPPQRKTPLMFLRPEIFNRVKLGDEPQIGLPCFALIVLVEPERPSVGKGKGTDRLKQRNIQIRTLSGPAESRMESHVERKSVKEMKAASHVFE